MTTLGTHAALAGAFSLLVEADEELELAWTRTLGNVEGHRAHGGEIADGVVDGDGRVDAHRVARHLGTLGIGDGHVDRQANTAGMAARPEQDATREAVAHRHPAGLDLALARRLGDLAAMHDGEAIPGA